MELRQTLALIFVCSFSAAAWPNAQFGHWPALLTVLAIAWRLSPWLGGRSTAGRLLDAGLIASLLTAVLALIAVQSARSVLLGAVSATLLTSSVAARLVRSTRRQRRLPGSPAELLEQLLAEPPEHAD